MGAEKTTNHNPFADAIAVWHMAEAGNLKVNGNVRLGIELTGDELAASLKRGGDGTIAEFSGGYLSFDRDSEQMLDITGEEMSLCIRLRNPSGTWDSPIFGKSGDDDKVSYFLSCVNGGSKPMYVDRGRGQLARSPFHDLFGDDAGPKKIEGTKACIEFTWGADPDQEIIERLEKGEVGEPMMGEVRNGIMRVNYPVALIGPSDWHDIIVRFTGPKLQLFIDGILVDEEFPIGKMRANDSPFLIGAAIHNGEVVTGFTGLLDHAALWNRALSDEEIVKLSGGTDEVKNHDTTILGKESDRMQYWRPRGHNTRAGDCMPFFHDGVYHLYFLVVRRNHHGKWQSGHGGLEIWHSSTRDLTHWEHHPVAIPISKQYEMWWGTGSVVFHEGTYYTLQKVPHMWEGSYRGIQLATSKDGIHFTKNESYPFLEGEDVDLYQEKDTGLYHLLTGKKREAGEPPTIKRLYSKNLLDWEEAEEPFIVTEPRHVVNICPHLFEWKGWFYFFGGFTERSGVWRSKNQFGPWILQKPEKLDLLAVPKTAEYPGDRRIFAGFLEDHGWGGNLVFRDLVQNADGSLGTKFPAEMIPESGAPLALSFAPLSAKVKGDTSAVEISAADNLEMAMMEKINTDVRITLTVRPDQHSEIYGLYLRGTGSQDRGFELKFEPKRQRVQFAEAPGIGLSEDSPLCSEDVAGLNLPFALDIIVKSDIIDICIDNRRTMVARYWNPKGNKIFFFAKKAEVVFESIQICPLKEQ